jgi:hypothetical protein
LGEEISELKAALTEIEAAQKTKMKATTAASEKEDSEAEVQRLVSCWSISGYCCRSRW